MKPASAVSVLLASCVMLGARPVEPPSDTSCVVILDERAEDTWRSDARACAAPLSPASTFKIPHALIALESGVITAETTQEWDGTQFQDRPAWQRAHQLDSAIRNSVLWFFQRTAVKIGAARMREFLLQIGYGNADTTGPPDRYWINGRLRISADGQIAFLQRFFADRVPVRKAHIDVVHRAMVQTPGTVQNATGVHTLGDAWDATTELAAKTGAGMALDDAEVRVSWLVGRLAVRGRPYLFASNIVRRGTLDPIEAARLAFRTFRERGLLRSAPK